MKKYLPNILLLAALSFLASCGSDDSEPPPHIVGTWELDSYILTNLPTGFTRNEGAVLLINELSFGGISFESYTLDMMANGTYNRKIEVPGPNIIDDGTWTIENDDLILDPADANTNDEYSVEKNANSQLWISQPVQFSIIEDAILDTLTQEYAESLSDEEFQELFTSVSLDLVFAFEK